MTIDFSRLSADVDDAWQDTAKTMAIEFNRAIVEPSWSWPRGESPRPIVDTGALRDSQALVVNGDTATYSWPVKYALIVHDGIAGKSYPARPWTKKAIAKRNPAAVFAELLRAKL